MSGEALSKQITEIRLDKHKGEICQDGKGGSFPLGSRMIAVYRLCSLIRKYMLYSKA